MRKDFTGSRRVPAVFLRRCGGSPSSGFSTSAGAASDGRAQKVANLRGSIRISRPAAKEMTRRVYGGAGASVGLPEETAGHPEMQRRREAVVIGSFS